MCIKRRIASLLTGLAAICVAAPAVASPHHPKSQLKITSVSQWPASRVEWIQSATRATRLSDEAREPRLPTETVNVAGHVAVGTTSIKPWLLTLPSDEPTSAPSTRLPRQHAFLELGIEAQKYVLFVGEVADDDDGFRHVTAAILSDPYGYARFTVNEREGLIAGTLFAHGVEFRIVPLGRREQVIVRLPASATPADRLSHSTSLKSASSRRTLARHLQAEAIARIQPWAVHISRDNSRVRAVGGDLGSFHAGLGAAGGVASTLERLADLTGYSRNPEFVVDYITAQPGPHEPTERVVTFRQLIEGIPVAQRNYIAFDRQGRILEIGTSVVDDSSAVSPVISISAAHELALANADASFGSAKSEIEHDPETELVYERTGAGLARATSSSCAGRPAGQRQCIERCR